jgi:predicted neutral ceramidase superfamily lipid hydrolase
LVVLVDCWGKKASCLVVLTLVLTSSLLVVLTVLLLLRKLPLILLALTLVLVTLLELLGWVAWVAGTAATPGLRSTNLAFPDLYFLTLPFSHDCSINQMMKGR